MLQAFENRREAGIAKTVPAYAAAIEECIQACWRRVGGKLWRETPERKKKKKSIAHMAIQFNSWLPLLDAVGQDCLTTPTSCWSRGLALTSGRQRRAAKPDAAHINKKMWHGYLLEQRRFLRWIWFNSRHSLSYA